MTNAPPSPRRWASRAFWAVTDQGLFSLSNFGMNVLLARWLSSEDYGRFVVAFTVFLLLATLHTSFLSEPMLVFGPGKYFARLSAYLRVVIAEHWRLTSVVAGLLLVSALGALLLESRELALLLISLAVATPLILFQWLARRACYTRLRPQLAASAGAAYALLIFVGLYLLREGQWLTAWSALLLMGGASFGATFWLVTVLGVVRARDKDDDLTREAWGDHWAYGRWAAGVNALTWVPGNVYTLVLSVWSNVGAAGRLAALWTLITPMMQIMSALGVLLLPSMVRARTRGELNEFLQPLLKAFVLANVVYWVGVGLGGDWLMQSVYHGKYAELHSLLWLIGLVPIFSGATTVVGTALRASERADTVFWAYVASSVATLTLGLLLTANLGVMGAAAGLAVCYAITAASLFRAYYRLYGGRADKLPRNGSRREHRWNPLGLPPL